MRERGGYTMRVDYEGFVNKEIETRHGQAKVIKYYGRDEFKIHHFDVQFINTGNIEMVSYSKIRDKSARDTKLLKLNRQKKKARATIARNAKVRKEPAIYSRKNNSGNVMAIDFATRTVGISVWSNNLHVNSHVIDNLEEDIRMRVMRLIKHIYSYILRYEITTVVIEDIYLGINAGTLIKLAEARGMLFYLLFAKKIRIEIVPVSVVRKELGMPYVPNGEDYRKAAKDWAKEEFIRDVWRQPETDDESDAYVIGKWFTKED